MLTLLDYVVYLCDVYVSCILYNNYNRRDVLANIIAIKIAIYCIIYSHPDQCKHSALTQASVSVSSVLAELDSSELPFFFFFFFSGLRSRSSVLIGWLARFLLAGASSSDASTASKKSSMMVSVFSAMPSESQTKYCRSACQQGRNLANYDNLFIVNVQSLRLFSELWLTTGWIMDPCMFMFFLNLQNADVDCSKWQPHFRNPQVGRRYEAQLVGFDVHGCYCSGLVAYIWSISVCYDIKCLVWDLILKMADPTYFKT